MAAGERDKMRPGSCKLKLIELHRRYRRLPGKQAGGGGCVQRVRDHARCITTVFSAIDNNEGVVLLKM